MPEDAYRRFSEHWRADGPELEDSELDRETWLREIAEPWWARMRELAHADGLVLVCYEGTRALEDYNPAACVSLARPDGTPYTSDQHSQARYADYGEDVLLAVKQRAKGLTSARSGPYASPLFDWSEPAPPPPRPRWKRLFGR